MYRRRFKAAVLHGHKIGHQKPKKPPDLDSSGSGFFVNSKFANVRQSLAASRCVSLATSAYSSPELRVTCSTFRIAAVVQKAGAIQNSA
ncbi:hypothetical protein, partial [Sutterella wadsworthensis]|uniref:hypothetical protein n=1 Tax=Sutterella wadsworthensis TaxID=40545 RepID=UPI003AB974BF